MELTEVFFAIRQNIINECVSWGEIAFLQGHAHEIPAHDILLCEWAGIEENNN